MHTISYYWVIPFILILLSIALFPLFLPHFWEKNRNKGIVSFLLALPVAIYLIQSDMESLIHTGHEFASFIILLASLFIVSGGICLEGDIQATPKVNTGFLAIGAILANIIGTTGASMLLIRPLLTTNKERHHTKHLPIFFIFIVSNIGGLLTPIGDPPLFLGYLKGVPFFWTLKLVPMWLVCNTVLLILFYWLDSRQYHRETRRDLARDRSQIKPLKLHGAFNFLFLLGIILAVFLPSPYREIMMLLMAILSLKLTADKIHKTNRFTFGPIIEVFLLFAGIFITMIPALHLLKTHGSEFGITEAFQFFWLTGILSSFLDNAPTYLTFFSLAQGLNMPGSLPIGITETILKAISCGAVLMGANTYIGNGPNFMVKAIAEEAGIKMPSFFGYMLYSVGILIPLFIVITLLFFR